MALEISDLVDLMRLLREHPDWRASLRAELLGEELISTPELVRQNSEAITRLEQAVSSLQVTVAENSAAITRLVQAVSGLQVTVAENSNAIARLEKAVSDNMITVDQRFDSVDRRLASLDAWIARADKDFAWLKALSLATHVRLNPHGIFHTKLRKMRVVIADDLDLFVDAEESGAVTDAESLAVRKLDLILRGRAGARSEAHDAYLAVELAWVVRPDDVERALARAEVLRRLGYEVIPAVAGPEFFATVPAMAAERNVEVFVIDPGDLVSAA
ncbi:MAG: hypothetical protein ACKVVT_17810 [Dehalococcoidia bacterium]